MTFASLIVCAFGAGWLLLRAMRATDGRADESAALTLAAGLGFVGVLFGVLGLVGRLDWARPLLLTGAALTVVACAARWRPTLSRSWPRPSVPALIAVVMVAAAGAGALAPTTEYDSLAYPIPIARHLAQEGRWRFWSDQALSVFPLSQEMLLVPQAQIGDTRLGLLAAVELALAAVLIASIVRRVTRATDAPAIAAIITLGCPAVAFLAASAKEDLLLLTMVAGAAVSLVSPAGLAASARVGLFAGFAAGAKLTGAPLALAALVCVPLWPGRGRPWMSLGVATLTAAAAGGLWYGVNLARFGTPLPLTALPGFNAPILSEQVLADWANAFGLGRGVLDAIAAPFHMAAGAQPFGGRGNWINALPFLGVAAVLFRGLRKPMRPLLLMAAAGYVAWFVEIQVARLLLPVLALLAVPAADLLARGAGRSRAWRIPLVAVLLLSAGVVATVGVVRIARYVSAPTTFLDRETPYYADITWMNANLDPLHDRVALLVESGGYLNVPWIAVNATYQTELTAAEIDDPARLVPALRRIGITHIFGTTDALAPLARDLERVHENAASRQGGSSFFRTPATSATAVYRIR